jgi:hypothetical protein
MRGPVLFGAALLVAGLLLVLVAPPSHAEHACREVARDVHGDAQEVLRRNESDSRGVGRIFQDGVDDNPECRPELQELAAYYGSFGAGDFPFPASEDPAHPFLGPVGWWWNTVYVDMMNRNTLMMVLFGWGIFAIPLAIVVSLAVGIVGAASESLRRGRRGGPA